MNLEIMYFPRAGHTINRRHENDTNGKLAGKAESIRAENRVFRCDGSEAIFRVVF